MRTCTVEYLRIARQPLVAKTKSPEPARVASLGLLVLLLTLIPAGPIRAAPSNGLPTEFRPSFPVFGGGKVVNFLDGDNQAMTNAAAHVGFSIALPLLGEHFWGRKGLWATGLSWMALSLVQESLFHAPANAGPGYPAEVRADLITRLVPCATLLIVDAIRGGGRASITPGVPSRPERPGMPWPVVGMDVPRPDREAEVAAGVAAVASGERAFPPFVGGGQAPALRVTSERAPAASTGGAGRAPALRTGCTQELLLQGSAACSWDTARWVDSRQLASR